VQRYLVTEKVKIDPGGCRAALSTAKHTPVKLSGDVKVSHVEGEVEKAFHVASLAGESCHAKLEFYY
jgi:hypothetical protein